MSAASCDAMQLAQCNAIHWNAMQCTVYRMFMQSMTAIHQNPPNPSKIPVDPQCTYDPFDSNIPLKWRSNPMKFLWKFKSTKNPGENASTTLNYVEICFGKSKITSKSIKVPYENSLKSLKPADFPYFWRFFSAPPALWQSLDRGAQVTPVTAQSSAPLEVSCHNEAMAWHGFIMGLFPIMDFWVVYDG